MAIEGLTNMYGIPAVKKKQEPGMNQKRKQKKDSKKGKENEEEELKKEKGKIDIRI
jgi:hypothetical protein